METLVRGFYSLASEVLDKVEQEEMVIKNGV
jgi:hypothetical protein